jgi:hypothetical protein
MDRSNAVFTRVEEGIIMKSDIDNTEVGKRLQNFREVRGLTRAVVALRLGILRETFSLDPAWLLGGQTP